MSEASILIVEDESLVSMALEEFLRDLGHRVVGSVMTGEAAIELAGRERLDIALMDVRLAGDMDGVETATRLRELYGVRSIFLTAYADENTLRRIKVTEPFGYVVKPFVGKLLEVTLEVALYRKRMDEERAEVERRLRLSEARYRNLARWSPVGIFEADADGRYRYVNETWREIAALSSEEAQGDGWARSVCEQDRARILEKWSEAVAKGTATSWECCLQHEDGSRHSVFVQSGPELENGRVCGFVGAMMDVTELRVTQHRLRKSEQTLEVVTSNMPLLLAELNPDLKFRFAHGDFEAWFGAQPEGLAGVSARDVMGPSFEEARRRLDEGSQGLRVDFDVALNRSQKPRWLRVTLIGNVGSGGDIEGYSLLALDVTALKQNEDVRRRAEARYATILDASPDAIVSVDDEEKIVVFSRGAERMFGYDASEVLGKPLDFLVPTEHRRLASDFGDVAEWRKMAESEITGRRKNGSTFPAEVVIGAVEDGGERLLTAIVRDVSDRRELEDQYFQAQKMEALGRLAGGVAHDFNNVLSSIVGQAELMKLDVPDDPRAREGLDEILSDCERAASLTRQLLLFSKQRMPEPKIIDVVKVVSDMERMLKRVLDESVELRMQFAFETTHVRMDPSQLEQIVVNLAVNARDAMPQGGTLEISVEPETVTAAASPRAGIAAGNYVALLVRDTGHGMDRDVLSRMFEPFFSTKSSSKGTGLGLATVFGIVQRARGRITAESVPGRGAALKVLLPRASEEVPRRGIASRESARRGDETILIVEDNDGVRRSTAEMLERFGYRVLQARDGYDAVKQVEAHADDIDLLLSDVVMPNMGGRELAERLARVKPSLKMMFMTGYSDDLPGDDDIRVGLNLNLLQKPFSARELTSRVREVLNGGGDGALQPRGTFAE